MKDIIALNEQETFNDLKKWCVLKSHVQGFITHRRYRNFSSIYTLYLSKISLITILFIVISLAYPAKLLSAPSDHTAALDLVRLSTVTHTAINNGAWSSPDTWSEDEVPTSGSQVHIPAGISVGYDTHSVVELLTVRVDGTLHFSPETDSLLVVDTIVVSHSGHLQIGSQADPINSATVARVVFTDRGPIDSSWDPAKISRGLIAMGKVTVWGTEKSAFHKTVSRVNPGQTSIALVDEPVGWNSGDEIVVSATRTLGYDIRGYRGTEDEVRVLSQHAGGIIDFAQALNHQRPGSDVAPDLKPYVANLSRNVRFESENGADTPTQQRGHTMFMSHDVDIYHAGFYNLGRTDKSRPIDDVVDGTGTNPRGRYAVHFHQPGDDSNQVDPAIVRGSVAWGSPGWSFAVHDGFAIVEDNVSFDVFGAHYVTENGGELGAFRRNIAIKSQGAIHRFYKDGKETHDFAHTGIGYWFQGRNVIVEDNVAVSSTDAGFAWFHRSDLHRPTISQRNLLNPIDILRFRETIGGISYADAPISRARGLEVLGAGDGLRVTKEGPNQGHDLRTMFDDLSIYNTRRGLHFEYTGFYTSRGLSIVNSITDTEATGIYFGEVVRDQVIDDAYIFGFGYCLESGDTWDGEDDHADLVLIDIEFAGCNSQESASELMPGEVSFRGIKNFFPAKQTILTRDEVVEGRLTFEANRSQNYQVPANLSWRDEESFFLTGTKTDSLGSTELTPHKWEGEIIANKLTQSGYYTRAADNTPILRVRQFITDRLTGEYLPYEFDIEVRGHTAGRTNLGRPPAFESRPPVQTSIPSYQVTANQWLIAPANSLTSASASDPDDDLLQVDLLDVEGPQHGSLNVNPNGSFSYKPHRDYVGPDQFTYRLFDGHQFSADMTANIQVVPATGPSLVTASIVSDNAVVSESDTTARPITVRLNRPAEAATRIGYAVSGEALNGVDVHSLNGIVVIPAGAVEGIIELQIINDGMLENSERLVLTLTTNSHGDIDDQADSITITINDDDTPNNNQVVTVSIRASDELASESANDDGTFLIELSQPSQTDVSVTYQVAGTATNNSDYTNLIGVVTIPAGRSSALIQVNVNDDLIVEDSETVVVSLSSASPGLIDSLNRVATVFINDNDSALSVPTPDPAPNSLESSAHVISMLPSVFHLLLAEDDTASDDLIVRVFANDALASEPNDDGEFTIELSRPVLRALDISYDVSSGTATNGGDYINLIGVASIEAGTNSVTVQVRVIDDVFSEGPETVILQLTGTDGDGVIDERHRAATVVIEDNESSL